MPRFPKRLSYHMLSHDKSDFYLITAVTLFLSSLHLHSNVHAIYASYIPPSRRALCMSSLDLFPSLEITVLSRFRQDYVEV